MLKTILTVLSVLTLGHAAFIVNIFEDCIGDCEEIYLACNQKSSSCSLFESYFVLKNNTWLNSTAQFIEVANNTCFNGTVNGTHVLCDFFVDDLIECIQYSSCWTFVATTPYSSDCGYYSQITANVTVTTSLTEYEICFAPWDTYFNNIFGGSSEISYLYNNCTFNYAYIDWSNSTVGQGPSVTYQNITISFLLNLTFYSEYAYLEFIGSVNGTNLGWLFGNSSFLNSTWLYFSNLTTVCCQELSFINGTGILDLICAPYTETSAPATTSRHHHSSALSIKPFFNLMIVSMILIFTYIL